MLGAMYKILRQLEKNMGNEDFDVEMVSAKRLKISFDRWEYLAGDSFMSKAKEALRMAGEII